jgi:hypothetical protein
MPDDTDSPAVQRPRYRATLPKFGNPISPLQTNWFDLDGRPHPRYRLLGTTLITTDHGTYPVHEGWLREPWWEDNTDE